MSDKQTKTLLLNDSAFSNKIKAQAVIEVLKEKEPVEAIAARYRVEVTTLLYWKQQVLDTAEGISSDSKRRQSTTE
ncbi:transposase [bacterium]|nr:transposase [bacterium]